MRHIETWRIFFSSMLVSLFLLLKVPFLLFYFSTLLLLKAFFTFLLLPSSPTQSKLSAAGKPLSTLPPTKS